MKEQPEALRLAEFYEALAEEPPKSPDNSNIRAAAAELRRLAAVEAQRDALLEALKLARSIIGHPDDAHTQMIDAAIAKAEEA